MMRATAKAYVPPTPAHPFLLPSSPPSSFLLPFLPPPSSSFPPPSYPLLLPSHPPFPSFLPLTSDTSARASSFFRAGKGESGPGGAHPRPDARQGRRPRFAFPLALAQMLIMATLMLIMVALAPFLATLISFVVMLIPYMVALLPFIVPMVPFVIVELPFTAVAVLFMPGLMVTAMPHGCMCSHRSCRRVFEQRQGVRLAR